MRKRKLLGGNNVTIRENTFMEGTEIEKIGYRSVYAVKHEDGTYTTLKELRVKGKLINREETNEDPFSLGLQFADENTDWEDYES